MKRILGIILVFAMVFSCFAVGVSAEENGAYEAESNNTAQTATEITGNTITGSLSDADDVDWFKFNADADYFEVGFGINADSLGGDQGSGWDLWIYDEEMNEIISYDSVTDIEEYKFAVSGTIYIKLKAANTVYWPALEYDFVVNKTVDAYWEDENNDTSNTAQVINANEKYTASMYKDADTDWYKFTSLDYFVIDFGTNLELATDTVENSWDVFVYDSSLQAIAEYTGVDFVSAPLAFEGDVYVKVKNHNTVYNNNYVCYDITANTYTDNTWETEYNDTSNKANTITSGVKYTANLYKGKDVDFFKFKSTTAAFKVKFDIDLNEVSVDEVENGWTVSVYPVDSASAITEYSVSSVGSFESITLPYSKNKEYFIKVEANVYSYAPVYQPYHITVIDATAGKKWENENGTTTFAGATALPENTNYYGNLSYGKDEDIYKYNVSAKGTLKITFNRPDSADDENGYLVQLKNAAGTVVKEITVNDKKSATLSGNVNKGAYYVVVKAKIYSYAPSSKIDYYLKANYTLGKPTLSSVAASGKKALKITWKKSNYVGGYEIQYSTAKSFANAQTKKISKNTTVSCTISKLTSNKTYYVRIRSFMKVNGKTIYSAWTTAKNAKTK